ncbi:hypothetical protein G6L46_10415 [Agrobacterium rhizogenes]|uniref:hypothetical protein n=1 Tax=Rhizobium rhizogenes TaxID=359 RepID=UPI00157166F3|nr:hypothetical protein [Rhizobium rhizogenes]NTF87537.1 hypothetical protein [Rhizobium rhizogenes]
MNTPNNREITDLSVSAAAPQLGGKPEDLRNVLCGVVELLGIEAASEITEYALRHRGLNAFDGSPAAHSDDLAVDSFYSAMKGKLAKKRDEGRSGWDDPDQCSVEFLSKLLREHVAKGDPVDVANFAMMIHQRGERISGTSVQEPVAGRAEDVTDAIVAAAMLDAWNDICDDTGCHPLDIQQLGQKNIAFSSNHWASAVAMGIRSALSTSQSNPAPEIAEDIDACPICLVPFVGSDTCSTDIEMGTCHAACLEGSPTVDLDSGEPIDGPIPTFPYRKFMEPEIAALRAENERLRSLRNAAECVVIAQHDERLGTAIERLDAALEAVQNAIAPEQEEAK